MIRQLKYPAIDGLRFYGAFLVFFVHFGSFTFGHHGVDLFFIISGFLITRLLMNHNVDYMTYLGRRILRIYPAFLVAFIVAVVLWDRFGFFKFEIWNVLGGLLFLNAIKSLDVTPYLWVSWSLGYEFAFYFLAPLAVMVLRRSRLVGVTLISVVAFAALTFEAPRLVGLIAGALIASTDDDDLKEHARYIPLLPILAVYTGLIVFQGAVSYLTFYYLLLPTMMAMFVKVVFDDTWLSRIMASLPLRFLGTISFSFYLWHIICIGITSQWWPTGSLMMFVTSMAMTIVAATISYCLLEAPYFSSATRQFLPSVFRVPPRVSRAALQD